MAEQKKTIARTPKNPEETKKELLKAALQVFCTTSYSAAKLEDIAREAGVTRGAISYHFKNKETVIKTLVHDTFDIDYYNMFPLYSVDNTPIQILKTIVEWFIEDRENKSKEVILFNSMQFESFNERAELITHIEGLFAKIFDLHAKLLQKGIDNGEFKENLNPEFETRFFYNFFWGFFSNQYRFFNDYSDEELLKHFEYNLISRILK